MLSVTTYENKVKEYNNVTDYIQMTNIVKCYHLTNHRKIK